MFGENVCVVHRMFVAEVKRDPKGQFGEFESKFSNQNKNFEMLKAR